MTHSTIDEKITSLFCVATAPLGPDVQRVIWKEVRDDRIRRTLWDINYFIEQFMICQREYPDSMTWGDGSFTQSTVNMVTTWVEFLEKRAAREIRPDITISYQYSQWVVSAEKEDLWIDLLKSELQIKNFIIDDIGKRQWMRRVQGSTCTYYECLTDEEIDVEIDRHCDVLRRLQELAGFRV